MIDPLPYNQWSNDPCQRQYEAERVFGRALMKNLAYQLKINSNKYAALAPSIPISELEALAKKAAMDGIYAVMMLLDGVASSPIDNQHGIEWVLQARIQKHGDSTRTVQVPIETGRSITLHSFRPTGTESVETIELMPDGDGLCYAFHEWKETHDNHNQP